jgi:predicted double-glycine peptidase
MSRLSLLFLFALLSATAAVFGETNSVAKTSKTGKKSLLRGVRAPDGSTIPASLGRSTKLQKKKERNIFPKDFLVTPKYRQATTWTCGVAATMVVANYWTGWDLREDSLAEILKANSTDGTSYHAIRQWFESEGFEVVIRQHQTFADLERFVDEGKPAMLLIQAWKEPYEWRDANERYKDEWEDGHYVVLVGYDDYAFYFMDPSTLGFFTYIPREFLMARWHDIDGLGEKVIQFAMLAWDPEAEDPPYDPDEIKPLY